MAAEKGRSGTETTFQAYRWPLTNVVFLKYISPLPMAMDNEFTEVVANLCNPHRGYYCMSRILGQEGAETRMCGTFIKAVVVQAILIFGSYMWLVNTALGRTLGGFHNMLALRMTKKNPFMWTNSSCYYLPFERLWGGAGLKGVEVHITCSQNMVVQ